MIFLVACLWPTWVDAGEPLRQVRAVVHVHSTWSTGDQSLEQLVARARAAGVEAIILGENFLQRFEYGLPPLRGLLRHRVEYPSLEAKGVERFLREVESVNARQVDVVVIPGAEIIPHYYWSGSLWRGTLTMHDAQKNLLALGLTRAEDYRQLPVVGNDQAGPLDLHTLWLASPVLLVIPGTWLLRVRRRHTVQLQRFRVTEERRLVLPGLVCFAAAVLLLANNYPFRRQAFSPYDVRPGLRPHQAAIDFIAERGGVAAWSLPEARDHQMVTRGPFRATIRTEPHPDALLETDRFTAFGGIYEDTTTFTQPGGGWDVLLQHYLAGHRAAPAWAIGEAAYHAEEHAGKQFGAVQTVLLSDGKEPAALLRAMREGRMYAVRRTREASYVLSQFQARLPGKPPIEAGGRLAASPRERPELHAAITSASGKPLPVEVRLIRSGRVVQQVTAATPVTLRYQEDPLETGARLVYRLEAQGPGGRILGNPVFVLGGAEAAR
jgi:hypothetical protein